MENNDFKIDDEKITRIASKFFERTGLPVKKEAVVSLYQKYVVFSKSIKQQYLAHIMRAMEIYFRQELKNSSFIVCCEPFASFEEGQDLTSADYFQGRRFVIYFKADLPEKDLRVRLAHEIGHLFLLAALDVNRRDKRVSMYDGTTEPLSSIFGIFALSDKNDFYKNFSASGRNHGS